MKYGFAIGLLKKAEIKLNVLIENTRDETRKGQFRDELNEVVEALELLQSSSATVSKSA